MSKYLDLLRKELTKEYGSEILLEADTIINRERKIVPVSPQFDVGLMGGVPEGSTVIISGLEKIGKSSLSLSFAAQAQKMGKFILYLDVENRIKPMNLTGIKGLDTSPDKLLIIQSSKEKILVGEDYLKIAEKSLNTIPESVTIVDSASALCAEKEYTSDITASARNDGPKLLANFCRKNTAAIQVNRQILLVIQHLIANTSGYGAKYMEDGGNKIKYQYDIKIRAKGSEPWTVGSGENEVQVGQKVTWNIISSALGGKPNTKVESYLRYGVGVDHVMEYIEQALSLGVIVKGGAWFTWGERKFQGQERVYENFSNSPEDLTKLHQELASLLCTSAT